MHQQPLQAPCGPKRYSSCGQSSGVSGRMASFIRVPCSQTLLASTGSHPHRPCRRENARLSTSCRHPPREKVFARQRYEIAKHVVTARETLAQCLAVRLAAELGKHMPRSGIVMEPARPDALCLQILEGKERNPMRRLAGVTRFPERLSQPVADLEPAILQMDTDLPHELVVRPARDAENEIRPLRAVFSRAGKKARGVLFAIGMRALRKILRDIPIADPGNDGGDVARLRGSQQQPLGFQSAAGHGFPLWRGKKKGDGGPSPSLFDEPPIFWRLFWTAALVRALRVRRGLRRRHVRVGKNRYVGASLEALAELDVTVAKREQGMVLADADILARPELGAALAHDDVSAGNRFAAENLHAESLSGRVASVARGAACFLVCHGPLFSARVDRRDLHFREGLAVTALPVGVLAALLLEGNDLGAASLLEDLGGHRSARDQRRTGLRLIAA